MIHTLAALAIIADHGPPYVCNEWYEPATPVVTHEWMPNNTVLISIDTKGWAMGALDLTVRGWLVHGNDPINSDNEVIAVWPHPDAPPEVNIPQQEWVCDGKWSIFAWWGSLYDDPIPYNGPLYFVQFAEPVVFKDAGHCWQHHPDGWSKEWGSVLFGAHPDVNDGQHIPGCPTFVEWTTCTDSTIFDPTADCVCDTQDLLRVLSDWGLPVAYDLDADGVCGVEELLTILTMYQS